MDYELSLDLYGRHLAQFSMGHEAFGSWLSEELATDHALLTKLLHKLEQITEQKCWEHRHAGREFTLNMTPEGIEVRAVSLDNSDEEMVEEMSHYDQESKANCGLDDFRQILEAWQEFTAPRRG